MKRMIKSVLGVTLLEIMLVLAIAAMIIVMSVRYYQSASTNQQANGALQMIQGITSAADNLAQGTGSYANAVVSTATIQPLMPNNSMSTPWGGTITVTGGSPTYSVSLTLVPAQVCLLLKSRLASNPKFVAASIASNSCGAGASFTYQYNPTL